MRGGVEMQHNIVHVNGQFVQHTFHFSQNSPLRSFIWAPLGNLFATRYPRDLKNFIGPVWAIFQLTALLKQNPGVTIFTLEFTQHHIFSYLHHQRRWAPLLASSLCLIYVFDLFHSYLKY